MPSPSLTLRLLGGASFTLPDDSPRQLRQSYSSTGAAGVPYCNAQLRAFQRAASSAGRRRGGAKVVALSVDDETDHGRR